MIKQEVFIVIVTYNGLKWLSKCLKSCAPYNVIVVDNNSSDNTVVFIQQSFPNVKILEQKKNLGFGQANNIGLSYALENGAEYVFLLNQDAYLEPNTVMGLVDIHKENDSFGILSPIHLNGIGTKLDLNFSNYIAINKKLQYDAIKGSFIKELYEVPFVNAAGWLLPKETLEKIGGFDPIFFHYAEDDNYCQRVIYHGLKIGVCPNYFLMHDRDNRKVKEIESVKERIENKERRFKLSWADININPENNISNVRRNNVKIIIKSFIRLNFKTVKYYINELRLIKRILPEIYRSRSENIKVGQHYLNDY